MSELTITKNDELVMKLLHYFITEQGYSPIVLHGAKDEIWLENLDQPFKVVRIVTNYIHNNEQMNFDIFKTEQIVKKIKKKTLSLSVKTLSIFVNIGENVNVNINHKNINIVNINDIKDLKKYDVIKQYFPGVTKASFKEKGAELFMRLTNDINKKSESNIITTEKIFKKKPPVITYILIAINVLLFMMMYEFGNGSTDTLTLTKFGANSNFLINNGEYYRLITSAFLHSGLLHLALNMYALYVLGPQIESFLGKAKFIMIYLYSAFVASLLSMLFIKEGISVGASGAIFGLLGSLLYFGYHYRIYLGGVLKSQIVPLIILNLSLGFLVQGIDNAAHIGGLIGGVLMTMTLGIDNKTNTSDKMNGLMLSLIFTSFLICMAFLIQ